MVTTSERLRQIMRDRGLRQTDILKMTEPYCQKYMVKINKSDLSQFVSGKVVPGQWKLAVLAIALNVSEAWLMGCDVPMERTPERGPTSESKGESSTKEKIIQHLDGMTDDQLEKFLAVIEMIHKPE